MCEEARKSSWTFYEYLRVPLKPSKSWPPRSVPGGAKEGPVLGPHVEIMGPSDSPGAAIAKVGLPGDKQFKYSERFSKAAWSPFLKPAEAEKLAGAAEWAASATLAQSLRSYLWPLQDHAKGSKEAVSLPLRICLETLGSLLGDF